MGNDATRPDGATLIDQDAEEPVGFGNEFCCYLVRFDLDEGDWTTPEIVVEEPRP